MEILVAGTGAMACLFAAKLSASGNKVTMFGTWREGLAALRQYGVRLLDLYGNTQSYPVRVLDGSAGNGAFAHALMLVKSYQTERAANQLTQFLSVDGLVLTLQNGLGNYEILERILGHERVALGVTTNGARMVQPGYVQYTGIGKISLSTHPMLGKLGKQFQASGFQVELVSDTSSLLWGKLVINAAINPLTALLRVENGELLRRPDARELLTEAALEAAMVAMSQGISLPFSDPVAVVEEVAKNTAPNVSSMLQDVTRSRNTEIDAINGAIVRAGEKLGVPTPINRIFWRLVKSIDQR